MNSVVTRVSYCTRSRVLLILGGANALSKRVLLTHVRAFLCVSVILVSAEMIDFRIEVGPDDDIARDAMRLGLSFPMLRSSPAPSIMLCAAPGIAPIPAHRCPTTRSRPR